VKVLIVGGGGREHALCWAIRRDAPDADLFCAPGNPGTALLATNLPIPATGLAELVDAACAAAIDLVVVGPEAPLAAGLVDQLVTRGVPAFGPTATAARIEASKAFAKEVMAAAGVATARSSTSHDLDAARRAIEAHAEPLVVKASGLAAGKGAVVCATRAEARAVAAAMLEGGRFGDAGREVVIEEFLEGEELSVLAVTDGERVVLLPAAQDHKRLGDGDTGPNTGGMGAYAPVSIATPRLLSTVREEVLLPTLRELARRGSPYRGVLYAGLMIQQDGRPAVIEFNCRFGDPEAQAVLPVTPPGLLETMREVSLGGNIHEAGMPETTQAAVVTVLAASGYPEAPRSGDSIDLPEDLGDEVLVFHAGTSRDARGVLRTAGGRVSNVVGLGAHVAAAAAASRRAAELVQFDGKVYRRDVAWRELQRAGAP